MKLLGKVYQIITIKHIKLLKLKYQIIIKMILNYCNNDLFENVPKKKLHKKCNLERLINTIP